MSRQTLDRLKASFGFAFRFPFSFTVASASFVIQPQHDAHLKCWMTKKNPKCLRLLINNLSLSEVWAGKASQNWWCSLHAYLSWWITTNKTLERQAVVKSPNPEELPFIWRIVGVQSVRRSVSRQAHLYVSLFHLIWQNTFRGDALLQLPLPRRRFLTEMLATDPI